MTASQGRRAMLVMSGGRAHLELRGNLVPVGSLARGAPLDAWVQKEERERKAPREILVLMGPQAGQASLGLEGPLDALGLMVFQGSLVLWVNQVSWDLLG